MEKLLKLVNRVAFLNFFLIILFVIYYSNSPKQSISPKPTPTAILLQQITYLTPSPLPTPTPIIINRIVSPNAQSSIIKIIPSVLPSASTPISTFTPAPTITVTPDPFASLSSHSTQSDCWIRYQNSLYNITSYFGVHPGGNSIMAKYCGKDATNAFNTKDKTPGTAHTDSAFQMLQSFKVSN